MINSLDRYIWREMMPTMVEATMLCTFVFLLQVLFKLTRQLVESWASLTQGAALLASMLPMIGPISIPVAFLLSTLLIYGRLAEEGEITAMMAGGISLGRIIRPAVTLGAVLTGVLLYWSHVVAPMAAQYTTSVVAGILERTMSAGIEPGRFHEIGQRHMLVAAQIGIRDRTMKNVQIHELAEDENYVGFIVGASQAIFEMDVNKARMTLDMRDGWLHVPESTDPNENPKHEYEDMLARFSRMRWQLDVGKLVRDRIETHFAGSDFAGFLPAVLDELHEKAVVDRDRYFAETEGKKLSREEQRKKRRMAAVVWDIEIEQANRIAMPFAVMLLAGVAAPLGVLTRRGRKGTCVGLTILVVLVYYLLRAMGNAFAETGDMPAMVAVWLPNAATLAVAAICYRKALKV